ncbi:MAG: glycosyltransferase family 39 protein, partial [Verrucomicrobia bacterium]|nr:glycosyltransferase family 39 protein [Verrucomicrobiota bacterium]
PAHSLWLAPGVLIGNARLMSALAAGLSVWLITGCALLLNIPALLISLLLLASPYFLFVHGSLLSHTSGILAVSLMLWAYLKWAQSARWGYAALAGLAWSLLLLNRTYTAALLAVPFGADALLYVLRRRTGFALVGTMAFALCAAVGLGCFLGYNLLTTANPLLTLYEYDAHSKCMGFGPTVCSDGQTYIHTISMGWAHLVENVLLLNRWLFGFKGSLLAALVLAAIGWLRRWSPLWLAVVVLICFGHMTFWYWGENNIGPYYYFETFPFLALMTALGLTRLWRWTEARKGIIWRAAYLTAAGAAVIASATFMVQESRRIQVSLRPDHEFIRHLHSAPDNALIAIDPALPARLDMLAFNPCGLDSQPLIVRPYEDTMQFLLRYFNGRNGYRLDGNGGRGLEAIHKTPLRIVFNPAQSRRVTGGDEVQPDGSVVRAARAGRDAGQMLTFGQFCYLYASRFAFEADLVWSNVSAEAPVWMDVATDVGGNVLVRHAFNGNGAGSVRTEFSVPTPVLVEPRIYYGGSGDIAVGALRIMEIEERARQ